jgi:hypothetical protein
MDLQGRLRQIRTRVFDPAQLILVVGESKQGKSTLINGLVNATVCPVGEEVSTGVPTLLRYAEEPHAVLVRQGSAGPATLDRHPVPLGQLQQEVDQALSRGLPLTRSEVGLPRDLLKGGMVLMDTPGVGGTSSSLTATTLNVITEADALVMVSDATQELTTNEIAFLKKVITLCPNVALVQPKIDLTPHWRRIIEVNRKHLSNAGISVQIFPVSSTVRVWATQGNSSKLDAESGYPSLVEYLQNEMAGKHEYLTRRLVAQNVAETIDQLTSELRTELTQQSSRSSTTDLVELESAQQRAEDLRRASSRWQKILVDGIQEMYSDMEFDFRERGWAIINEINEVFSEADPKVVWDEFTHWLTDSLTDAIATTFEWLDQRAQNLSERLAHEFPPNYGDVLPTLNPSTQSEPLDRVPDPKPPTGAFHKIDQALTGLRGSYTGFLMFGLISSRLMGIDLFNGLSISAGLLLGSKSLMEEKDSRLLRRQAEAKGAAQRYVEQLIFQINKDIRDAIRVAHRALHEHFMDITEEAQASINQSIQEVRRSAERDALDRDQRSNEVRQKLEELALLRRRALTFASNSITAA